MPVINCGNVKLKGSKEAINALLAHLQPKPKAHTVELVYLETCTSDYFQGFSGQVYAVSAAGKPRVSDIKRELLACIRSEELWVDGESAPVEDYAKLKFDTVEMFRGAHPLKRWSQYEAGEDCYAYFGVRVHEGAE